MPRPALPAGVRRPRRADDRARPPPPVDHRLVAGQRVRATAPNHDAAAGWARRADPSRPLHYEGAIRFDWSSDRDARATSPARCTRRSRRSSPTPRAGDAAPPAGHVRVQPRDGQQQRHAGRVLGRDRVDARAPGRLHLGVARPRARAAPARRDGPPRATAATSATRPTTASSASTASRSPTASPKPGDLRAHVPRVARPGGVRRGGDRGRARGPGRPSRTAASSATRRGSGPRGRSTVDGERGRVRGPAAARDRAGRHGRGRRSRASRLPDAGGGERWLTLRFLTGRGGRLGGGRATRSAGRRSPLDDAARTGGGAAPHQGWTGDVALDDEGYLLHPSFAAPPALSLWRAPTDNDRIGGMADRWAGWGLAALTRRLDGIERAADAVTVARDLDDGHRARDPAHASGWRAPAMARIRVEETVEVPPEIDDLAAGRHGRSSSPPGHEAFEWFGRGPHETYPDRARGGRVGRWRSTVADQLVAVRPPAGERRPRRHALVPGRPVPTAAGSASTSTARARSPPPTSTAADLDAATHDVELRPRAETIVHIDAAHRGVGTASCGPDTLAPYVMRRRQLPLGVDAPLRRRRRVTIHWDAGRPRVAPRERPHELGDAASSRTAGSATSTPGAPLRQGASRRHLGPCPFDGLHQPGRRAGRRSRSRCRASATSGSRRWSSRARTARRSSTCATRRTASSPGKPELAGPPVDVRGGRTTRRTRWRSTSSTSRPACGSRVRTTLFADRPVVARSLTLANGGAAALTVRCAMSAVARPPGRRLAARHAERRLGARAPRPRPGPRPGPPVGRQPARRHRPRAQPVPRRSAAPRRPRTPARRSG